MSKCSHFLAGNGSFSGIINRSSWEYNDKAELDVSGVYQSASVRVKKKLRTPIVIFGIKAKHKQKLQARRGEHTLDKPRPNLTSRFLFAMRQQPPAPTALWAEARGERSLVVANIPGSQLSLCHCSVSPSFTVEGAVVLS